MRQLLGVWVAGSVTLGTLALLFVLARTDEAVVQPLVDLGYGRMALVALLVLVLFVALAVLSGLPGSWLTGHARERALWTLVVFVGGLAGWGYAGMVALDSHWSPTVLLLLAYLGGGLPFTVVAAALARSADLATVAVVVAIVLLVAGAVIAMRPGVGLFGLVRRCAELVELLFSSGTAQPG